ncbi:DUF2637 domain-containing protein [Streptomyces sp. 7N604]|uniref:DUF2637 domain-containing protein n=1 Tax=Streptomyces sp. 7N604 TaxID=3457415 RepID=UPI003FD2D8EC
MTTEALAAENDGEAEAPGRDWLLGAGMAVVGIAAAASSFAGLRDLALRTGWLHSLTWLLPLTVDAYAMTATRVWLAASTRNARARAWAKANAIGAIAVSVGGNAVDHAAAAKVIPITWPLIVAVSAIPPVVLGLLVHMAHLRSQPATDTPEAVHNTPAGRDGGSPATGTPADEDRQPADGNGAAPLPSLPPAPPATKERLKPRQRRRRVTGPKQRQALPPGKTDDELITAAREHAANGGEPSATWLMKTYGIGTRRAARIRDASTATSPSGRRTAAPTAPVDLTKTEVVVSQGKGEPSDDSDLAQEPVVAAAGGER